MILNSFDNFFIILLYPLKGTEIKFNDLYRMINAKYYDKK